MTSWKTNSKRLLALLILLITCLTLASCDRLEELKETHAVFSEDGILYQDNLYCPVDSKYDDFLNYNYGNHQIIRITQPDVPLLLTVVFHRNYYLNEAKTIIKGIDDVSWYVRKDQLEAYRESVQNGIRYTTLGFDYYDPNLGEHTDYILNESELQTLLACLSAPCTLDQPAEEELPLFEQSDNGLFRRTTDYYVLRSGTHFYLLQYDQQTAQSYFYSATAEASALFEEFFRKGTPTLRYEYGSN